MSQKLIVTAYKDGSIIRKSGTKGWGSIMVVTSVFSLNNGVLNENRRVAHIKQEVSKLEALGLKVGDDFNAKMQTIGGLPCRIARRETLKPAYEGQKPKMIPLDAKKNPGQLIKSVDGSPIYMQDYVAGDHVADELILSGTAAPVAAIVEAGDTAAA